MSVEGAIAAQDTREVFLSMVRLSHESWSDDLRFVNNGESVWHHGQLFLAFGFELAYPDEEDGAGALIRWSAVNVGREITARLRGLRGAIDAEVFEILASDPETIQDGPYQLKLFSYEYDRETISGAFELDPFLDKPVSGISFAPSTFPGLF